MPNEYWMQVLKFETSNKVSEEYKLLEGKIRDRWEGRSVLSQIDLEQRILENTNELNKKCYLNSSKKGKKTRRYSGNNTPRLVISFRKNPKNLLENITEKTYYKIRTAFSSTNGPRVIIGKDRRRSII